MRQQWLIKITDKRRVEVDVDLVIQAVITLWQQLRDKRPEAKESEVNNDKTDGDEEVAPDAAEGTE